MRSGAAFGARYGQIRVTGWCWSRPSLPGLEERNSIGVGKERCQCQPAVWTPLAGASSYCSLLFDIDLMEGLKAAWATGFLASSLNIDEGFA